MSRILVLIDDRELRRQVDESLSRDHPVVFFSNLRSDEEDVDLVVVDDTAWERSGSAVERRRNEERPLLFPVVLVTASSPGQISSPELWGRLDEVLTVPVDQVELRARCARLLQARQFSQLAHAELGQILDSMIDGIAVVDRKQRVVRVNQPLTEILGQHSEELLGHSCAELFCKQLCDSDDCPLTRILVGEQRVETELEFPTRHRGTIHGLLTVSPFRALRGKLDGAIFSLRDITEQRHAEEEKQELQKQLHHMHKMDALGMLAGGVAHDFNNVLAVILSYAHFSQRELPPNHPVQNDLSEIVVAAKRATNLIDQLLSFSRRKIVKPESINLNDAIQSIETMLSRTLGEDIRLETELAANLGLVNIDRARLEQVILNLCVNAREAMPQGGRLTIFTNNWRPDQLPSSVSQFCEAQPGVMLTVTDTGGGISREVMEHIFEPFYTTKKKKGTGLGLATVHGIITQAGGWIDIQTEIDKGTSFRLWLPRAVTITEPVHTSTPAAEPGAGRGETVLVAEDDKTVRTAVRRILEADGYNVIDAEGGLEALELASVQGARIDVLLSDVVMPDMNGHELAQKVTERYPEIKVVYMSGYSDDVVSKKGVLRADVMLVQKPFSADQLLASIWHVLHSGEEVGL